MKKNNKGHIVSNIKKHKEERLELFDKKIKEKFATNEEFFKNFRFREETFKRKLFEGSLLPDDLIKTKKLLNVTNEELTFLYFGDTFEEQRKFLITQERMTGQTEEVKKSLNQMNEILKHKSIEAREIFLRELQKTIKESLRGSEVKWWKNSQE